MLFPHDRNHHPNFCIVCFWLTIVLPVVSLTVCDISRALRSLFIMHFYLISKTILLQSLVWAHRTSVALFFLLLSGLQASTCSVLLPWARVNPGPGWMPVLLKHWRPFTCSAGSAQIRTFLYDPQFLAVPRDFVIASVSMFNICGVLCERVE